MPIFDANSSIWDTALNFEINENFQLPDFLIRIFLKSKKKVSDPKLIMKGPKMQLMLENHWIMLSQLQIEIWIK